MSLTENDLKVGRVYRAKRFQEFGSVNNDRIILWMNEYYIQYDSDTVRDGRNYPTILKSKFLAWAKCEVTEEKEKDAGLESGYPSGITTRTNGILSSPSGTGMNRAAESSSTSPEETFNRLHSRGIKKEASP